MSDFEKLINASDLIEWIIETCPDWCEGAIRSIVDHIDEMPSAQPEKTQLSEENTTSDCISRHAAIDALGDEPEVWSGDDEYAQGLNNQWHYDVNSLKAVPSVQPEIVPCGDCKHWICHDRRCGYWNHGVKPLEWCCHAERKEN